MKLTNLTILNGMASLSTLSQEKLPISISYQISKNISKLNNELKIYNEERQKLINKYGKKDENDKLIIGDKNEITFKEECKIDWNRDFSELLSIENEIDIAKISIDSLEGIELSPNEIMSIEFMIEE